MTDVPLLLMTKPQSLWTDKERCDAEWWLKNLSLKLKQMRETFYQQVMEKSVWNQSKQS